MPAVKMICSMAPRELLQELVARYRAATSKQVDFEAAGGVDVAKRVRAGEAFDVVVMARNNIDDLATADALRTGTVIDIAASAIAAAVRSGAPRPALDNEADFKRAVLATESLSYSTGPSGVHLEKQFAAWGILENLRARIVIPPPGVPVGKMVAAGKAMLGFQQLCELVDLEGIDVLRSLPPAVQLLTTFSGALAANCADVAAADALLRFLASRGSAELMPRFGMQPCAGGSTPQ